MTSSELRAMRLLTAGIGLVAACALIAVATVAGQMDPTLLPPTVQVLMYALLLSAAVVGIAAFALPLGALRATNGALAVLHLVLLASVWTLPFLTGVALSHGQLTWLLTVVTLPVLSALLAWDTVGGWTVYAILLALVTTLRLTVGDITPNSVTNDVHSFSTALMLCALGIAVLRAARGADVAAAAAHLAGIREAEASARRTAQVRAQALVHDEVLAVLGFAARATAVMREPLATHARRAGSLVRELATSSVEAEQFGEKDVDPEQLVEEVSALADRHRTRFLESGARRSARIPGDVVETMLGAVEQALVNRAVHAPHSACTVELIWTDSGTTVIVADNGPGFDVEQVSGQRMGVAISIVARMRSTPGGDAVVRSSPDAGTEIRLSWRASGPPDRSERFGDRAAAAAASPALRHRDLRLVGLLVIAGELILAACNIAWTGQVLPPIVAGAALAASFALVLWLPAEPRGVTLWAFGGCGVIAVGTLFWRGSSAAPTYAELWPVVGAALALGLLCLRGRPVIASLLLLLEVAVVLVALAPAPAGPLLAPTLVRSSATVLIAVLLAFGVRRFRETAERDQERELTATSAQVWQLTLRNESRARAQELLSLVGPMLDRIAHGEPLTEAEASECRVLEGRLRDEYRGGRLASGPVLDAADAARRRGVDVVLIDDVPERELTAETLDAIRVWLAGELDGAQSRFVGRMLPEGRSAPASAVSDVRTTDFGG